MSLYLDGFGIDRSDLVVLSSHPFAGVKLMASTPLRTLRASLAAARALDQYTVAKAIETPAELEHIEGCDAAQGFAIARPANADATARFLASRAQFGFRPMTDTTSLRAGGEPGSATRPTSACSMPRIKLPPGGRPRSS